MIEWHSIQIRGNKNLKKEEWRKYESDRIKQSVVEKVERSGSKVLDWVTSS